MAKSTTKVTVTVGLNIELGPELEAFIRSLGWVKSDEVEKSSRVDTVINVSNPSSGAALVEQINRAHRAGGLV